MTLNEVLKQKVALYKRQYHKNYGNVIELDGKYSLVDKDGSPTPLNLLDLTADDWELESPPKIYYVGMLSIQTPSRVLNVLQAYETPDNNPPTHRTSDGKNWVKCVEVKE